MLEAVKQWAFTLVITAIVGGLANSFTVSENGGMKKYVKFACAAVALAVMIMPIKEIFRGIPDLFNFNISASDILTEPEIYDYDINELAAAKTNELLKYRISDIVYEKTGIKPGDVYIYIGQKEDYQEYKVEKIIIEMPENKEIKESEETRIYIEQLFNCEVNIHE